jgi:hypothetical protein
MPEIKHWRTSRGSTNCKFDNTKARHSLHCSGTLALAATVLVSAILTASPVRAQCSASDTQRQSSELTGTTFAVSPNQQTLFLALFPTQTVANLVAAGIYQDGYYQDALVTGSACGTSGTTASWIWTNRRGVPALIGIRAKHVTNTGWNDATESSGTGHKFGVEVYAYGFRAAQPPPQPVNMRVSHSAVLVAVPLNDDPLSSTTPIHSPSPIRPRLLAATPYAFVMGFPSRATARIELIEERTDGMPAPVCSGEGSDGASFSCKWVPSAESGTLAILISRRAPDGRWAETEKTSSLFVNSDLLLISSGSAVAGDVHPIAVIAAVRAN